jgi:release factor glutamine methyltransferase
LLAHGDAALAPDAALAFAADMARRADGVPLAQITGQREFHGLALSVTPDVLDPRPDTEVLVDWALALLAGPLADEPAPRVIDLGTGSGAIALAVKHACPRARVLATDTSAAALAVAAGNAQRLGLEVEWSLRDWWRGLAPAAAHLVLGNPPYIAANDPHLAALRHEPLAALTPGGDGLGALQCIVDGAPPHLQPGAWLLLEHGHDQAARVQQMLAERGFGAVQTRADLAGHGRCSGGRWPG